MAKIDLSSAEWCDLVFAGKNRAYGACQMRESSPRRHNIAVAWVLLLALAAFSIPALLKVVATPRQQVERMVEVTVLSQLEEPEIKQEEMKRVEPVAPPPPALKSSVKFTAPVIRKDEEVSDADEIKGQDELTHSELTISIADVKGNDEVHGQDIADLKEVILQAPVEQEQVFDMVEQMPQYPGGVAEMMKFIAGNLVYPVVAAEHGVQGRVVCQFVVGKDGAVRDISILKTLDPYCDREAVRVLGNMPRWIPGKQNGQAVAVKYTLPITFRLK